MVRINAIVLSALVLTVSAMPLAAQNVHISRLYEQVLENIEFTAPGHVLDSFGVLRIEAGKTADIELDVPANSSIEIMGDCDEDCYDLDIAVYNLDGRLLAEDRLDDYYPIVLFESGSKGRVRIEIDLVDCEANYCYAAYSVFVGG